MKAAVMFARAASFIRFDNLAHAPSGAPAKRHTLRVYRLHRSTGTLTLLAVNSNLENPAFLRFHPEYNVLYACTEDITKDNEVWLSNVLFSHS